jgi:hypothetical protein
MMRYKRGGVVSRERSRKAYPGCGKTCHARADDSDTHCASMHDVKLQKDLPPAGSLET